MSQLRVWMLDVIDIGHFALSRPNCTDVLAVQEFHKGLVPLNERFTQRGVVRVRLDVLPPVVGETVSLKLKTFALICIYEPETRDARSITQFDA
jgi:hypothetical protein